MRQDIHERRRSVSDPDPHTSTETREATGLDAEVRALREELTLLRQHRMFLLYQSVPKVLFFRMLTGMAVGLGTVIGATFLLSIAVWALSQIEFLPIIGDWSAQIAQQIEAALNPDE
mgnify:CR=1 FL=1